MTWNWQQPEWPHFSYDAGAMEALERRFLHESGVMFGAFSHLGDEDQNELRIDIISSEAFKTSEIEGEHLNRDSLQSSIRRQFGLSTDNRRVSAAEQGIAEMMMDVYRHFAAPLSNAMLFNWHSLLTSGRRDLMDIGRYRTHADPMQIVSGGMHAPKIHFEAPPSERMATEMKGFISWFNDAASGGHKPLPALTRAGMAHLYFESIHPFEDGNGRIGRALSEKALAQNMEKPTLFALAYVIEKHKKSYYQALERANTSNRITDWLLYFADTVLEAQAHTRKRIEFIIEKTKLYRRIGGELNARQQKALERMFREGPEGFKGGLSAEKYISITGATRPTATRDLQDLVKMNALVRTGERRHTRYYLNMPEA